MKNVRVELGERAYDIVIGAGVFEEKAAALLGPVCRGRVCLIVSDANVFPLYGKAVEGALEKCGALSSRPAVFPDGERSKNLSTLDFLLREAVKAGLDRSSVIVGLGGGVVGDVAGFLASVYMRGVDFVQIPATLLAMVDSSVGGKTGVDLPEGKNLVGAFWQPRLVVADTKFLETLPEREIRCGLAEIVKYGVILDEKLFSEMEAGVEKINARDPEFMGFLVGRCCEKKADVVRQDERGLTGLRAVLNYGHTFGHGLEAAGNFADLLHGEAVSVGMCMAADLAVRMGILDAESAGRQERLLSSLSLPCRVEGFDVDAVLSVMGRDKKKKSGKVSFILPRGIGSVARVADIDGRLLREVVEKRCS
jgi:3-dehydroquinate synthase